MLYTGGDTAFFPQVIALVAADHACGNQGVQVGVLTGGFHHTPPARIAHKISHRGEGNVNPGSSAFLGRNRGKPFTGFQIKACAHSQRDRQDGPVAVDHIRHEEQGDLQAAILQMPGLQFNYIPRANAV
ncbi:hypothetical protein D3C75_709110 [compost metagenome]